MKNITKRLLASILAAGTLLTVTPAFAEMGGEITKSVDPIAMEQAKNDELKAEYAEELALLGGLGIISDTNIKMTNSITRGEFLNLVMKMIQMDGLTTENEETVFYDVLPESDYYNAVMSAHKLGLVNGDSYGCFNPNQTINAAAALKILVCALEFRSAGEAKGGYPNGFIAVARDLDIVDSVSVYSDITWKDAIAIVYNALHSKAAVKSYDTNGILVTAETGEQTVLEKYYDVVRYKGIVEETNLSLRMQGKSYENTVLEINGKHYDEVAVSQAEGDELLGKAVIYYIKEETDEIICIAEDTKYNTTIVIEPDDIQSANKSSVKYWDKNDKEKKISISANAVFYYNGALTDAGELTADDLKPENGTLTLIDNNNGDGYDYVIVKDYRTMVLARTAADKLISKYNDGEGGKPFEIDLTETDVVFYKDGYEATKYHIGEWDVLNIMLSKDKKAAVVEVSNGELAGVVGSIKTNKEDKTILTLSGKEVEIADYYVEAYKRGDFASIEPKKGNTYTFALDGDGRIVGIKRLNSDELNYGVLVGAKQTSKLGDNEVEVKIYGNFGEWIETKLADNVKINGKRNVDFMTAATALGDRNGKGLIQLVQYRKNLDGEITEINFAEDRRGTGYDHTTFSLDDANKSGSSWEQNPATGQVTTATASENPDRKIHYLDKNGAAPMFYVPYSREKEEYVFQMAVGNMNRYGTSGTDIELYDVVHWNEDYDVGKIGAVIVYGRERGSAYSLNSLYTTGLPNSGLWIVDSVYETVDALGDVRMGIDLISISDGSEFTAYFADTVYNADIQGNYGYGNLKAEDLKNGDIVSVSYDAPYSENPMINLFAVYLRKADMADFSKQFLKYYYANLDGDVQDYFDNKNAWPTSMVVIGEVVYADDSTMIFHTRDASGRSLYFGSNGGGVTWEYSVERDKFAKSSYSVLGKGDRVALRGNGNGYAPQWIIRIVEE